MMQNILNENFLADAQKLLKEIQDCNIADTLFLPLSSNEYLPQSEGTISLRNKIVLMYRKIDIHSLPDFTPNLLSKLCDQIRNDLSTIKGIEESTTPARRVASETLIKDAYTRCFDVLLPFISYSAAINLPEAFAEKWQTNLNEELQHIKNRADNQFEQFKSQLEESERLSANLKALSAEVGVVKQAVFFEAETNEQFLLAKTWGWRTFWAGLLLGTFAFLSLVASYIPSLKPTDGMQAVQLATGKVLFFGVLAYWVVLSARNFMAHKHNAVVNRHRENALKTFMVLADGAVNSDNKDIVLTHAANCIFGPQETGYAKSSSGGDPSTVKSIVEVVPKILPKAGAE